MTPLNRRYGWLAYGRVAYETSSGTGIQREPIYGLTVVAQRANGTLKRARRLSCLFNSARDRRSYVRRLARRFSKVGR